MTCSRCGAPCPCFQLVWWAQGRTTVPEDDRQRLSEALPGPVCASCRGGFDVPGLLANVSLSYLVESLYPTWEAA